MAVLRAAGRGSSRTTSCARPCAPTVVRELGKAFAPGRDPLRGRAAEDAQREDRAAGRARGRAGRGSGRPLVAGGSGRARRSSRRRPASVTSALDLTAEPVAAVLASCAVSEPRERKVGDRRHPRRQAGARGRASPTSARSHGRSPRRCTALARGWRSPTRATGWRIRCASWRRPSARMWWCHATCQATRASRPPSTSSASGWAGSTSSPTRSPLRRPSRSRAASSTPPGTPSRPRSTSRPTRWSRWRGRPSR